MPYPTHSHNLIDSLPVNISLLSKTVVKNNSLHPVKKCDFILQEKHEKRGLPFGTIIEQLLATLLSMVRETFQGP